MHQFFVCLDSNATLGKIPVHCDLNPFCLLKKFTKTFNDPCGETKLGCGMGSNMPTDMGKLNNVKKHLLGHFFLAFYFHFSILVLL